MFKDSEKRVQKYPVISLWWSYLFLPQPIFKILYSLSISFAGENCQLLRMMDDLTDIFITRRRRAAAAAVQNSGEARELC